MIGMIAGAEVNQFIRWFLHTIFLIKDPSKYSKYLHVILILFLGAALIYAGYGHWNEKMNEELEWDHKDLQDLNIWIRKNTQPNAIFTSEMVLTAVISLTTDRVVTNHPHYEGAEIRAKTKEVYKVFYCLPAKEVWKALHSISDNSVNYLVVAVGACDRSSSLWNANQTSTCHQTDKFCSKLLNQHQNPYFKQVYRNPSYSVFSVLAKKK
eukprot:TRINITY_DN6023_c0_g1_i2.p1 TRINITY_DN6023_c0_g1~~TRINITY_DN6023_c0_g1_i2.p1  ORF type:complete len:225 (-),score=41.67 TRINITY_DN6023_c0_g1_i2:136-765(-)